MSEAHFAESFNALFPNGLGLDFNGVWAVIDEVKAPTASNGEVLGLMATFKGYPKYGWRWLSNEHVAEVLALAEEEKGWYEGPVRHKDGFVTFG